MKIKSYYLYLSFILWLVLLAAGLFGLRLNVTGFGISLAFLTLSLTPGVLFGRILSSKQSSGQKILSSIAYSLVFYFSINLLALLVGLTLTNIEVIVGISLAVLFLVAVYRDRGETFEFDLAGFLKAKTLIDWIMITTMLASALLAFFAVSAQSDKLIGDGWFHLAILEKITSGVKLTPASIWITKDAYLNPVYSFPVWHILIGLFAKILHLNIFTALRQIALPLSIIALLVWWSLIKIIFKNRYLAWLVFLSLILVFFHDAVFYYLVPLASPDSFNRLIFLPLILGLGLDYVTGEGNRIPTAVFVGILAALMGVIHFIQYIDLVVILAVMGLLSLFYRQLRAEILKIGLLLAAIVAVVLPYLLIVHHGLISSFLAANAALYKGDIDGSNTPSSVDVLYRYAILAVPMILLYLKKEKRLILPVSLAITGVLISWRAFLLRAVFLKYFGAILTDRGITLVYNFLLIGLLIYLLTYLLAKVIGRIKSARIIIITLTGLVVILSLIPASRIGLGALIDKIFYNNQFFLFNSFFWPLLIILSLAAVLIWWKYGGREILEPQNKLNFSLMGISMILLFVMPFWGNYQKTLLANKTGGIWANRASVTGSDIDFIGGQPTIDFINSLPKSSVFIGDNPTFMQQLLLYAPVYAAEYPYSISSFTDSETFFDPKLILAERVALADKLKVNYVILEHPDQLAMFSDFPADFQLVHQSSTSTKTVYIFEFLK